jgi:CRISPR/Cas system-associated endonuclease Cas1
LTALFQRKTRCSVYVCLSEGAAGFDPACAFLHADRRGCDALVYDVMELARPSVDERVLIFLQATTFHAGDDLPCG